MAINRSQAISSGFEPAAQSNQILDNSTLNSVVHRVVVQSPLIAERHKAGHFVMVRADSDSERIPLTIADSDPEEGTITLIVQAVGASTRAICNMRPGESLNDLAGPLGRAAEINNFGSVILVGGGVGSAVLYPQAKALKEAGNRVSAIIGGRSREFIIMEREFRQVCDPLYPCTDNGSYGFCGFVSDCLREVIGRGTQHIDRVVCAGPPLMMKAVANITRAHGIKTIASLSTIMIDGTGMCGGCRVTVGGKKLFACVDGPEFDAHLVDFDELCARLRAYRVHEKVTFVHGQRGKAAHACRLKEMAEQVQEFGEAANTN